MIMYKGYDIVATSYSLRARGKIFHTVFWYPFSLQGAIEKRGGFLNEEDAIGYAKCKIDERLAQLDQLRRLKDVSSNSSRERA